MDFTNTYVCMYKTTDFGDSLNAYFHFLKFLQVNRLNLDQLFCDSVVTDNLS